MAPDTPHSGAVDAGLVPSRPQSAPVPKRGREGCRDQSHTSIPHPASNPAVHASVLRSGRGRGSRAGTPFTTGKRVVCCKGWAVPSGVGKASAPQLPSQVSPAAGPPVVPVSSPGLSLWHRVALGTCLWMSCRTGHPRGPESARRCSCACGVRTGVCAAPHPTHWRGRPGWGLAKGSVHGSSSLACPLGAAQVLAPLALYSGPPPWPSLMPSAAQRQQPRSGATLSRSWPAPALGLPGAFALAGAEHFLTPAPST